MASGHEHASAAGRNLRPLRVAFGLVVTFLVVETVAGFLTGSLALLSDAGHMATDALGLGMALAAVVAAGRASRGKRRTYGLYRLEILAALANAGLLFGVAGWVLVEAVDRFNEPIDIASGSMLVVAVLGLIVNVISWFLLREGSDESLNIEGAALEVLADLIGSVGVILAALIIRITGWPYADPLFAAGIGVFILPRAWRLGREALRILVQAAPAGVDLDQVRHELQELSGVVDVHDLHVWTLTSGMEVASAHLMIRERQDPHQTLDQARELLSVRYDIRHATLQVEPETHEGCSEMSW